MQSRDIRGKSPRTDTRTKSRSKSPTPEVGWGENQGWTDDAWGTIGSTSGTTTKTTPQQDHNTKGSADSGADNQESGWDDDSWDSSKTFCWSYFILVKEEL